MAPSAPMETDVLVDEAYATAEEPSCYDEFMDCWERYVDSCLAGSSAGYEVLHAHFKRALQFLEHMDRAPKHDVQARQVAERLPAFAVAMDGRGRTIHFNRWAKACNAEDLLSLPFETGSLKRIQNWMKQAGERFYLTASRNELGHPVCLLVSLVGGRAEPSFVLSTVDTQIDEDAREGLQRLFDLSGAEAMVAAALARGDTPAQIAQLRGASIHTVRTQIKRVLKKTEARGIPDLVRLVCGFAATFASHDVGQQAEGCRWQSLRLRDGRVLSWAEQGDPAGMPVLFFHNMLYGVRWSASAVEACERQGLRVISASRPGYGESDPNSGLERRALVDATLADNIALLDHLGVASAVVMGQAAGSIYAQRFAVRHPERCNGLLMVSHVPVWDETFMNALPRRQRLVARTTRHLPSALPFVTRAGGALIQSGRADLFMQALHQNIPDDMRALGRPDVYAALKAGLEHTVCRGSIGFCADCPLVLTDWSEDAARLSVPTYVLHGSGDRVVTNAYLERYRAAAPHAQIEAVEGAGQFLLQSHWPQVLKTLKQFCT